MGDIIRVQNVTKTYPGGVVAVDDLTLQVYEGEFVTLLGPSGCGKTTTLRMIAGFETPTSGRISLAGVDVTDHPPYKREVNTVFQDYALFPHMTITQNVGYGLRVTGVPKHAIAPRVNDILKTVGLTEKADQRPSNLSGGQKQRVALARALVRKPRVLLLDEPLSALDANLRAEMQVELKHLHEKLGLTFIYVTHDQREALVMSDRIVVMHRGRIQQSATPTELYDSPASPYVAQFIGTSNMIDGQVVSIDGGMATVRIANGEIRGNTNGRAFTPNQHVLVCVRPEKILVNAVADDKSELVTVTGSIIDSLFHGSGYRMEVDIGEDAPLLVDVQLHTGAGEASIPNPGDTVRLGVSPSSVIVFSRDEGPA